MLTEYHGQMMRTFSYSVVKSSDITSDFTFCSLHTWQRCIPHSSEDRSTVFRIITRCYSSVESVSIQHKAVVVGNIKHIHLKMR